MKHFSQKVCTGCAIIYTLNGNVYSYEEEKHEGRRYIGVNCWIKNENSDGICTRELSEKYPDVGFTLLDLADYELEFSDGRHYLKYGGDTTYVVEQILEADAIIIGTPIFQASIPGTLKNIFDLLPEQGLRDKVVSMVVTAGSSKHFLIAEQQLKPILAY